MKGHTNFVIMPENGDILKPLNPLVVVKQIDFIWIPPNEKESFILIKGNYYSTKFQQDAVCDNGEIERTVYLIDQEHLRKSVLDEMFEGFNDGAKFEEGEILNGILDDEIKKAKEIHNELKSE